MTSFKEVLLESLKECSAEVLSQKVKNFKATPEDCIIWVLSTTFLKISPENCPQLSTIADTVVETCESANSTSHEEQSKLLRELCFKAVGDYKDYFRDTLLYREAVEAKQPNVELLQKFFVAGFDKNAALINFVFKAVQQSTCNKEKAKILEIILDHKKSIEPEDISEAIKSNNVTLLNLYFKYRSKWTGKSIPANDIIMAIESNFLEVIKVCCKSDQTFKNKMLTKDKKTQRNQFFDIAVEKSNITTIKYILDMLENNESKEIFLKNIIDERVIKIAEARMNNTHNDNAQDAKDIHEYLSKKLNILNNQKTYLRKLFQFDSVIIQKIHEILKGLCEMYKKDTFFHEAFSFQNDSTHDLLQLFKESDGGFHEKTNEYKVITQLNELGKLIGLLGTHDGGIKEKLNMIPWRELKRLPSVLVKEKNINQMGFFDARKLLEQISADILKLTIRLGDLIDAFSEKKSPSFEKFSHIKKTRETLKLDNVYCLTKKSIDIEVITFTLEQINILESLNFSNVCHRWAFIQCMQNIGEKYNHFSTDTQIFLKNFDFIKKLRNEIAHIWNKHKHVKKFLTLLERDNFSQEKIIAYFNNWSRFTVTTYKDVLGKMEANYGNLSFDLSNILSSEESNKLNPRNFLKCLEELSISPDIESKMPFTDSLVDRQMYLLKYIITHIQNVIDNVTHLKSYGEIRNALKLPTTHLKCVLILTIVGESIHSIKNEDDYLSVAEFSLLKEFDFLKWVRNALMHFDNIDEKGTLIDYFSNDLLMEFSISTHGQKIVEFSKYFDYLVQVIDDFQKTLKTLLEKGNFLQNYTGQDKLYLSFDLKKKCSHIKKTLNSFDHNKILYPDSNINDFNIKTLLANKAEIEIEGQKLKITVLGLFGMLPIRGFTSSRDSSGLLVSIDDDSFLDKIAEFKQFVCNKFEFRLKVVELRQLEEYLERKVSNTEKIADYKKKILERASKYSFKNLENNMALIHALACDNVEQLLSNEFNPRVKPAKSLWRRLSQIFYFSLLFSILFSFHVYFEGTVPLLAPIFIIFVAFYASNSWVRERLRSPWVLPWIRRWAQLVGGDTPLESAIEQFCKLAKGVAEEKAVGLQSIIEEIDSDRRNNEVTEKIASHCMMDVNRMSFDLSLVRYDTSFSPPQRFFSGPVIHQLYDIYEEFCDRTFNGNILKITEEILSRGVELFAKQDREGIKKVTYKLQNIIGSAGTELRSEEIEKKREPLSKEIRSKAADIYAEQNYSSIRDNVLGFLKEILDKGTYLAEKQRSKRIKGNILRLVKDILDRGANINITDPTSNKTILHKLCHNYDEAFFTILTKNKNLNVNLNDWNKKVPLETALQYNNAHLIEFLKHKTSYKESLLIAAARAGNVEYIEHLISTCQRNVNRISFNIQDEDGTPVVLCAIGPRRYDDNIMQSNDEKYRQVMKLLVENGAAVTFFEDEHPLRWSLKNNDIYLSQLFAEHATDLQNYYPRDGILPIHQVILNIKLFPEKREGYIKTIEQVAEKSGSKINSEFKHGSDTPLFLAAKQNDLEVMKILIKKGADINYKRYRISNIVRNKDRKEIIEFFIDKGMMGAYNYLDNYKNYFNFCERKQFNELKRIIVEQSLSLNAMDSKGRNLLWYAIKERCVALIEWLSRKGALLSLDLKFFRVDPDFEDGESYYDHLCAHANGSILHVLQEMGVINWEHLNSDNIKTICNNALQNDDLEAIHILEECLYFDLTPEYLKRGKVKEYVISYLRVFSQTLKKERKSKESGNFQHLRHQISKLKNKLVLFNGLSLLHAAVNQNRSDIIKYLLNDLNDFDKNILDFWQRSALDCAIEERSGVDIIKFLIYKMVKITSHFPIDDYLNLCNQGTESGEKYNIILEYISRNSEFKNILFEQAFKDKYLTNHNFYKLLLELGWNPNEYESSGKTVLHKCAFLGLNDSIKVLCESGKLDLELLVMNTFFWLLSGPMTAVGFALIKGKFSTAKLLIEYGASPYKYLQILLLSALHEGDIDFTNLLLSKSVVYDPKETEAYLNVWLKELFGVFNILQAMSFFHNNRDKIINMPDYLYENLANLALDAVKQYKYSLNPEAGYTALYIAAEQGRRDIFKSVANGTDFDNLTSEQKQKLLTQAEEGGEKSIIHFLSYHCLTFLPS